MWILNVIKMHPVIFMILGGILIFNIIVIIFLVRRDRLIDKAEIKELTKEIDDNLLDKDEEVIDNKVYQSQMDLENLLIHMQNNLEAKPIDVIEHFENDQEENSIISYKELVDTLKTEKNKSTDAKELLKQDVVKVDENIEKPENVEPIKTEIQTEIGEITKVEIPEIKEKKKFKRTEFISPIFGRQKEEDNYLKKHNNYIENVIQNDELTDHNMMLEENLALEPLREEIKRNDEFLQALKEFRKNL